MPEGGPGLSSATLERSTAAGAEVSDRATRRIHRIVLIGHENDGSRDLLRAVTRRFPTVEFTVVLTEGLYHRHSLLGSVWRLLREASLLFVLRRSLDLIEYRLSADTMVARCRQMGIPVIRTRDVNSEAARRAIEAFHPDLIVLLYTMHLLNGRTIRIPRFGAIGSHPSILPHYRGLEVFFWALANGEPETGVSVYFLRPKVDAGQVICQERVLIAPDDSVRTLYHKVTAVAQRLLCEAIVRIDDGTARPYPVEGEGSYFPMPTREAYRRFQRSGRRWR